jgi:hypothetical protein
MFLLGTFVTGGALGFTADRILNRDQVCTSKSGPSESSRATLANRLGLSPDQSKALDSILDDRGVQYKRVLEPVRASLDSARENARNQIRRMLRDEQRARFEALILEMQDTTRGSRDD